jgi:type VI protein secretion system component VasK
MKQNIKNQSAEERMIITLRYAKNTLYTAGICGKLFQIGHYAEELVTANQDTTLREQLEALDSFRDFVLRAKRKNVTSKDVHQMALTLSTALNVAPLTAN